MDLRKLSPRSPRLIEAAALILQSDPRLATCMIWRCRGDALLLAANAGEHSEECPLPAGGGIASAAVRANAPVRVGNNKAEERTMECYLFSGSELAVPIPGDDGAVLGALHVQSQRVEAFTPADEAWLTGLAAVIAAWLEPPIHIKRVYDPADPEDGLRVLCTTRWPRGIRKEAVDAWKPELGTPAELIAPRLAGELGDEEFRAGVMASLSLPKGQAALKELAALREQGTIITLLTSVKDRAETHLLYVRELLVRM